MTTPSRRLLVVAPSAELYGSDRCLLNLFPELGGQFRVTVAVPHAGPAVARFKSSGADVVVLGDYAIRRRHLRPSALPGWAARVGAAVRRLRNEHRLDPFSLVYSNTLAAGIGSIVAGSERIPHLLHVHECPTEPPWLPRVLLRVAAASADVVVCNSDFTRRWVLGHQPRLAYRATVVHNGIELPTAPERPNRDGAPLRISCVGRIHPKKGQGVLMSALGLARADGRHWEADFFGDALPEHEALRLELVGRASALGVAEQVHWLGFVDDPQTCYGEADVAVVPSVQPEEFSLVCVEAQAMGVPVVATGPGGASEVLADQETGLIVPPGDPGALYRALAALDDNPARRRAMGANGPLRAATLFSRELYAERLVEVIDRAAAPAADRPPTMIRTGRPARIL